MKIPSTPNELKTFAMNGWTAALAKKQRNLAQPVLCLNEWDGELWITEKHWAVRASRFKAFFEKHKIELEPGVVYLDAVAPYRSTTEPPNLAQLLDQDFKIELEPTWVRGKHALFEQQIPGAEVLVALYQAAEPQTWAEGIRYDWLRFILDPIGESLSYSERLVGPPVLRTPDALKAVGVYATLEHRTGGFYRGEIGTPEREWVPEEWAPQPAPYLLGIVMPTKLD